MRSRATALLLLALSPLGIGACGGTSRPGRTASVLTATVSRAAVKTAGAKQGESGTAALAEPLSARVYRNDADKDPSTDEDPDDREGNKVDEDNDYPEDHMHPENGRYHDYDEAAIVSEGHPADAAVLRAIAATVERYYAAARAGDGRKACAMIYSPLEHSIVEDYAVLSGPSYMRGAKTCPQAMERFFAHSRSRLDGAVLVTGARVVGERALALLGSRTLPAGNLAVHLERGVWRIDGLLGGPLL